MGPTPKKTPSEKSANPVPEGDRRFSLFEAVFRDFPDAIVLSDPAHNCMFANLAFYKLFGYSREYFTGRKIDVIYDCADDCCHHIEPAGAMGGRPDIILRKKSGETFAAETSQSEMTSTTGSLLGYITVIKDVSAQREMEIQIQHRTMLVDLMRTASESLPQSKSAQQAFKLAIELVCDFTGWTLGHVLTLSYKRAYRLVSSDIWHNTQNDDDAAAIMDARDSAVFGPAIGVPGRTFVTGSVVYLPELSDDPTLSGVEGRFVSSVGIPVGTDDKTCAVLEFFLTRDQAIQPDSYFLNILGEIGTRLGQTLVLIEKTMDFNKLVQAVEQSQAAIIITDREGVIEYVNPSFSKNTGYAAEEAIGNTPSLLKSGRSPEGLYKDLWENITQGRVWRGEILNRRKDGSLIWEYANISPVKDNDGEITHYVAVKEDITVRKEYEERLVHQAHYDELTGLPKKLLGIDRLTQAVTNARRDSCSAGIIYMNVDGLQKINESLGHDAGDAVLRDIARRVKNEVRETDTVARIEGDEFMVIAPELKMGVVLELTARRIIESCNKPLLIDEHEVKLGVRIGLSVFPADGDEPSVLMRNAHAAMNRSREKGGNTYTFFTPKMETEARNRLVIESHLRHALENEELHLNFQPQIDLTNGSVSGAEALVRWSNPELGSVPPDAFIPIAESSGLINEIGEWVLWEACRTAATWPEHVGIAVNVSVRQFENQNFINSAIDALDKTGLAPERLEVEMTERLLIGRDEGTAAILLALSDCGIKLSIDDFGTGYSSLGYLKRYPFDTLKIDKSFIDGITLNDENKALTRAIVAMAEALELNVVAEGVETGEQLDFLKKRKCKTVQGYYFSKPLAADAFLQFLKGKQYQPA